MFIGKLSRSNTGALGINANGVLRRGQHLASASQLPDNMQCEDRLILLTMTSRKQEVGHRVVAYRTPRSPHQVRSHS